MEVLWLTYNSSEFKFLNVEHHGQQWQPESGSRLSFTPLRCLDPLCRLPLCLVFLGFCAACYRSPEQEQQCDLCVLLFCGPGGIAGHSEQHCTQVWHHTQRAGSAEQAVLQSSGAWPGVNLRPHWYFPQRPHTNTTSSSWPFLIHALWFSFILLSTFGNFPEKGAPHAAWLYPPTSSEHPAGSLNSSPFCVPHNCLPFTALFAPFRCILMRDTKFVSKCLHLHQWCCSSTYTSNTSVICSSVSSFTASQIQNPLLQDHHWQVYSVFIVIRIKCSRLEMSHWNPQLRSDSEFTTKWRRAQTEPSALLLQHKMKAAGSFFSPQSGSQMKNLFL